MTNKYKLITYKLITYTDIPETMEIAQRLAFSHGYKWVADPYSIHIITSRTTLVFDPNNKGIESDLSPQIPENAVVTVCLQQLNAALKNPELDATIVDAGDGIHDASVWEDSITFRSKSSRLVGTVTVPKSFIRKALGGNNNLPVVCFEYPDSRTNFFRTRVVRVTRLDNDYILGFEIPYVDSTDAGFFKKYLIGRVGGNIRLRLFLQS